MVSYEAVIPIDATYLIAVSIIATILPVFAE
jgi:hypothetical protein